MSDAWNCQNQSSRRDLRHSSRRTDHEAKPKSAGCLTGTAFPSSTNILCSFSTVEGTGCGKADQRGHRYNPGTWWYEGMNLPGSTQMRHLRDFFTALEWWKLEPRFADPAWCRFIEPEETVLATKGDERVVVYAYGKQRTLGSLTGLAPSAAYAASWFDPRSGLATELQRLSTTDSGDLAFPSKPNGQDWVLLLTKSRGER